MSRWSRRRFLQHASVLGAAAAFPELLFARTVTASPARFIVVVLRGAMDGLSAVPPYADPSYAGLRREIAIAAPAEADGALRLDGLFGLHPALAFMHERYLAQELLVFQAVASPYRERSHFDGQNVLENGLTQPVGSADGWLNRALGALPVRRGQAERGVAISQNIPLILRGRVPVLSKSAHSTPEVDEDLLVRLADLYSNDAWMAARLSEAVQTDDMAAGDMAKGDTVGAIRVAPPDRVTAVARMAARIMRSESGPDVAVLESTGWDTHANQGAAKGTLAARLAGLDRAMRALRENLGPLWSQTNVLIVTEFGRTAAINGTRGTDHGTGACAFLLGGSVRGGRVHADWPGLAHSALLDARDLTPTLDLRSVYKGVLSEHLGLDRKSLDTQVFPDSGGAPPLRDLVRA